MTDSKNMPLFIISKLIENSDKVRNMFKKHTNIQLSGISASLQDLRTALSEKKSGVYIIGPDFKFEEIENAVKNYEYNLKFVMVVILSEKISRDLLKKAIKLGITDILQFPLNMLEFKESFEKINKTYAHLMQSLEESPDVQKFDRGKNIMIFGTKGGSGKSFIACNLAVSLRKQTKKEVILFDLHYDYGDLALLMNVFPKQSVYDLSMVLGEIGNDFINNFLTTHSSGVKILPAPLDPAQAESIDIATTIKIFDILNLNYNYTIVDCPPRFSEEVLSLLKKIDYLCMIASMDVSSIKNMKISLQLLERLKFPPERIIIVINRSNAKVGIEVREIEETIFRKIDVMVPSSIIVPLSMNMGKPVVESYPKSSIAASISKLSGKIISRGKTN